MIKTTILYLQFSPHLVEGDCHPPEKLPKKIRRTISTKFGLDFNLPPTSSDDTRRPTNSGNILRTQPPTKIKFKAARMLTLSCQPPSLWPPPPSFSYRTQSWHRSSAHSSSIHYFSPPHLSFERSPPHLRYTITVRTWPAVAAHQKSLTVARRLNRSWAGREKHEQRLSCISC